MKKLLKQLSVFTIVAGLVAITGVDAIAAAPSANVDSSISAGNTLLADLKGNLRGTLGTTIGLFISLIGMYTWIWKQNSFGIVIAIGGALLTAFPDIYDNLILGAEKAFSNTIAK